MAATNQYSDIYFNRSLSTITDGKVAVLIRPDVVAVVRWELNPGYRYYPYESLSPGQTQQQRQQQMLGIPGLRLPLDAHRYKLLMKLLRTLGLVR